MSEPPPTEPAPARGRLRPYLVVAAVALLVGALGASAVFVLAGRVFVLAGRGDQHQYAVSVFLTEDATAGQKAAIESALRGLHPDSGIGFETREQAWQRFKEQFKSHPDVVSGASADAMPESFRLTKGSEFDCAQLEPVKRLPGIDEIKVVQHATKGHPGAVLGCG